MSLSLCRSTIIVVQIQKQRGWQGAWVNALFLELLHFDLNLKIASLCLAFSATFGSLLQSKQENKAFNYITSVNIWQIAFTIGTVSPCLWVPKSSFWPLCSEQSPGGHIVVFVKCHQLLSQSDAGSLEHVGWIKAASPPWSTSTRLVFPSAKGAGSQRSLNQLNEGAARPLWRWAALPRDKGAQTWRAILTSQLCWLDHCCAARLQEEAPHLIEQSAFLLTRL